MSKIFLYFVIIVAMIALIPLISLVGLFISEYFFISTGVETFNRQTLLGIMPFWLPFLWAYAFMIIGRCIKILDR